VSEPIVVEVRRNGIVEAVHRVHAVAVRDGAVVAEAGDGGLTCFMRSSSKPLQALPLARARDDLGDDELAIACASHVALPEQIAAARLLLAKAAAGEDDLDCGVEQGRPPEPIHHNCSGKHAGMLALCRARGWPLEGYRQPEHPCQQAMAEAHAEAAEVRLGEMPTGVDGCGVVTFALALHRMAHAFARLERLPGGSRVATAMRRRPELIGAPGRADVLLMRALPHWIAKGGAEGLVCAAGDGLGIAAKCEDGGTRALAPALGRFLGLLGLDIPQLAEGPLTNSHGERVGALSFRS
jgi:L-asparaginase II